MKTVKMTRDVPEAKGQPTTFDVNEKDVDALKLRGWKVAAAAVSDEEAKAKAAAESSKADEAEVKAKAEKKSGK